MSSTSEPTPAQARDCTLLPSKKRHLSEKAPTEPTRSSLKPLLTSPKPQNDASLHITVGLQVTNMLREIIPKRLEKVLNSQRTDSQRGTAVRWRSLRTNEYTELKIERCSRHSKATNVQWPNTFSTSLGFTVLRLTRQSSANRSRHSLDLLGRISHSFPRISQPKMSAFWSHIHTSCVGRPFCVKAALTKVTARRTDSGSVPKAKKLSTYMVMASGCTAGTTDLSEMKGTSFSSGIELTMERWMVWHQYKACDHPIGSTARTGQMRLPGWSGRSRSCTIPTSPAFTDGKAK